MTLREFDLVSGLIKLCFSLQLTKRKLSQRAVGESEKNQGVGGCIYEYKRLENVYIQNSSYHIHKMETDTRRVRVRVLVDKMSSNEQLVGRCYDNFQHLSHKLPFLHFVPILRLFCPTQRHHYIRRCYTKSVRHMCSHNQSPSPLNHTHALHTSSSTTTLLFSCGAN